MACARPFEQVGEHCFWMSRSLHTFESCQRDICGPMGAALACVRRKESELLAWRISLGTSSESYMPIWIGYSRASGKWAWTSECENRWSNWTNWMPADPDTYCGGEDCAAMTPNGGRWTDLSCRMRLPCLCERDLSVTASYNLSVAGLRDDSCYVDCGGHAKWCSAWPFPWLYKANEDLCHWEVKDGESRGRGARQCIAKARKTPGCGRFASYSVGSCSCSPVEGRHTNCSQRVADAASDVFLLLPGGGKLEHPGQRCAYENPVDSAYFAALKPATTSGELFRLWLKAAFIWMAVGLPCFLVMLLVGCSVCGTGFCGARGGLAMPQWGGGRKAGAGGGSATAYGPLLDPGADAAGTGDAVHRWVLRGAAGAILYGVALLALGASLAAHMAGRRFSFAVELMESLVMAVSKAAVARAAYMVHARLAPTARQVAGSWVLIVAVAKGLMAVTAFLGALVFGTLADEDYENVCFAEYLFRWSLLLALPLQCVGGVGFWRLHRRAQKYAGDGEQTFGGLVALLVLGNFVSGAGVWWAGYLDSVHRMNSSVTAAFFAAAFGQLAAGLSLLFLNFLVQQHFSQAHGQGPVPATQMGRVDEGD